MGKARRRQLVELKGVNLLFAITEQGQVSKRALLDPQVEVVRERLRRPSSWAAALINRELRSSLHPLSFSTNLFTAGSSETETIHASGSTCAWHSVSHLDCTKTEKADGSKERKESRGSIRDGAPGPASPD